MHVQKQSDLRKLPNIKKEEFPFKLVSKDVTPTYQYLQQLYVCCDVIAKSK